ncbi:MAG: YbbR-like domain-containing protein [Proteobacteria bacterium]|nr:YbbR-like domain-containing protein [Pseudomonadota bacterium]NDC24008.1 YbbR-like domain-containing protein [Pseudomonadota bacterium]NDD05085.1 YbbR-like domain-containing protein [Pseudomonadota bacterium]NDG27615.1 YbbR-like domain-containing protein [Pseudomonadota bacterium]
MKKRLIIKDLQRLWRSRRGALHFTESLALKAVSVLLALILWITILSLKAEEKKLRVPLQPLLPARMKIINNIPGFIEFTLSGPRVWLKQVEKRIQPIQPDLRKTRDTTIGFSISEDLLGELPVGVRVVSFYPSQILIHLDEIGERYILVKPKLRGTPSSGYEVREIKTFPSKVAVSGPLSVLDALEAVGTEELNVDDLKGKKEATLTVEVDEQKGLKLTRESTVRVKVNIRKVDVSERAEERK